MAFRPWPQSQNPLQPDSIVVVQPLSSRCSRGPCGEQPPVCFQPRQPAPVPVSTTNGFVESSHPDPKLLHAALIERQKALLRRLERVAVDNIRLRGIKKDRGAWCVHCGEPVCLWRIVAQTKERLVSVDHLDVVRGFGVTAAAARRCDAGLLFQVEAGQRRFLRRAKARRFQRS